MSRDTLAVTVAALVVLAGCGAAVSGPDGGAATTAPEPDVTTPLEEGSLVPDDATSVRATVVDVVDGDTLDVRYLNGTTDTVRLLGVDTPEVHVETDPAEFEGVPDSGAGRDCLRAAGEDASAALAGRLAGAEVRLVFDANSDRRDRYDRLLAYVVHDGRNVNYWLVATGHARVFDSDFRYAEQFYAAERSARREGRRVWSCRTTTADTAPVADSPLALAEIHADAADHGYVFPDGAVLAAGERLTLHTGSGADGDGHYYWASDGAVWNNGGDTIRVYDDGGRLVLSESY